MQPVALILSFAAMISLGVSWFLAARVSKHLSPLVSTLLFQAVGIPFFLFLFPFNSISIQQVNFSGLIAIGVFETLVMLVMFKAMKDGNVSIVLPIIDSYVIVTFVLGVIFLAESLTTAKITALVLTVVGIVLLSTDLKKIGKNSLKQGVVWAILGSVGGGVYLYFVTLLARGSGWFYTALIIRASIALSALGLVLVQRSMGQMFQTKIPWIWLVSGAVLDALGFSLYNAAVTMAETSKVTVITSSSSLIIVLMGVVILKEKMNILQIVGALSIVGGIMLLQL